MDYRVGCSTLHEHTFTILFQRMGRDPLFCRKSALNGRETVLWVYLILILITGGSLLKSAVLRPVCKIAKSNYWIRHTCPTVILHGTTRLPVDGFS